MKDDVVPEERETDRTEWYRTLVAEVNDLVTVTDTDGRITYVSPAVERVLGHDPEELIGRKGREFVHPDDRDRNVEAMDTVLSNPSVSESVEVRFRHADGSWRWIEATLRNRLDDGVVDGILLSSRDITERKQYEVEAQALADEYEAILNNVEDAIFLINVERDGEDARFEFERLSPSYEENTGITTEEVRGQTPREVFGDEQGATLEANYHRCINAGTPISYQEELPVNERARFWQTKLAPVVTDGDITRLVGITRNVTERVERERRLRQQNERLDEFAGVISHDLRNPLTVAKGRAALLAEQTDSSHLDPLRESLDRMEAIVEDTLMLARQGDSISETESVSLTDLVGRCWATVDTEDASIEIVDEMTFQGDAERLRHVFENLFRNAIEHGGSDVTVRVGQNGERGLYVEDDGPGIPVEMREDVFEPGESSAPDGTGFGLAIVKRIVEAHGWEVTVSDGTDGGTRFEFETAQ
ncbi:PAS domain S-box protein [Halorubellus salinus]|uniref:PAS domain S-box protein n=1 Tax=Halorubellus salinus TaxID=755309 RepID=UPI001D096077|nr:PAS domain S-box protein [Halorubellus salinus]